MSFQFPRPAQNGRWPGLLGWIGIGCWCLGMLLLALPVDAGSRGAAFSRQLYFALAAGYGWLVGNLVRARCRSRSQASSWIVLEALSAAGILLLALVFVVPEEREEEVWTFALALLVYATLFFVPFLFDRRR